MKGLNIQSSRVEDPILVKSEIKKFFENIFREKDNQHSISFKGLQFHTLNDMQASKLVKIFSKEAVCDCEGNKSLGPDGYNFSFIKVC